MAYQIYEDHYDQQEIILAGIQENGYLLAKMFRDKLKEIAPFEVKLEALTIDKKNPIQSKLELSISDKELKNKCIVVVDDVLNSGKTMIYGLQAFLGAPVKKLSTAVLINRSHNRYPVKADYIGMSLSTTLKEHIEVDFSKKGNFAAYLD
jgi:pyrimidine operon attenuation protein/uracil phosphoribosyltransferase